MAHIKSDQGALQSHLRGVRRNSVNFAAGTFTEPRYSLAVITLNEQVIIDCGSVEAHGGPN